MSRVLLTGFEPFGGDELNSSWEAVRLVGRQPPPGIEVRIPDNAGVSRSGPPVAAGVRAVVRAAVESGEDVVMAAGETH